jgi:hypothetical protein
VALSSSTPSPPRPAEGKTTAIAALRHPNRLPKLHGHVENRPRPEKPPSPDPQIWEETKPAARRRRHKWPCRDGDRAPAPLFRRDAASTISATSPETLAHLESASWSPALPTSRPPHIGAPSRRQSAEEDRRLLKLTKPMRSAAATAPQGFAWQRPRRRPRKEGIRAGRADWYNHVGQQLLLSTPPILMDYSLQLQHENFPEFKGEFIQEITSPLCCPNCQPNRHGSRRVIGINN